MSRRAPRYRRLAACCALLLARSALAQTSVDIGTLYSDIDSFRFGEYSGVRAAGGYLTGKVSAGRPSDWNDTTGRYWRLDARNLGLETANVDVDAGRRGRYALSLDIRNMPHYRFDGVVQTPFRQAGSARQTLPGDWTGAGTTAGLTQLDSQLRDISIDTDRRHLSTRVTLRLNPARDLKAEYQRQYKKGNDTLGAIFGSNGGNPRGAVLAAPVDYVTDNFSVTLAQQQADASWSLFYRGSRFANGVERLQWQNPFNNSTWLPGAGYDAGAFGSIALAPDNAAHSLGVAGLATLRRAAQVSGSLTLGRMLQDEVLLPYSSVFAAATPPPATRLNGRINTARGALNYTQRLGQRLTLRLHYDLDSRDNDTRSRLWLRVPGDSAPQADPLSANARVNLGYSHVKQQVRAQTVWRLPRGRQLQLEYRHTRTDRDFTATDLQRESQLSAAVLFALGASGRGRVEALQGRRRADQTVANAAFIAGHNPDYIATLSGNQLYEDDPLLRRHTFADRDRNQLAFTLSRTLPQALMLSLNGKRIRDAFPDSLIGRQTSAAWDLSLTLSQSPSAALDWSLWYTRQGYRNRQAGYSRSGSTPILPLAARLPANDWWVDTHDEVASSGFGGSWHPPGRKLHFKADLSYTDAGSAIAPFSSGLAYLPLPDVDTRFSTLTLGADFALGATSSLELRYRYDDYATTDFALDALAVDTLSNVILLGNASPVYSGSLVQLSYRLLLP